MLITLKCSVKSNPFKTLHVPIGHPLCFVTYYKCIAKEKQR